MNAEVYEIYFRQIFYAFVFNYSEAKSQLKLIKNFFSQNFFTNSYITSNTGAVSIEIPSSITEMDSILSVALIREQQGLHCRNCSFTCNINEDKTWQIDFLNFVPARSNHCLSGEIATCGFVVTHFSVHTVIVADSEGLRV